MFDFTKAQQEAIETLDRNVSVSAGAGSGKTRVLVERFVNILRQSLRQGGKQVSAADILAITFTRKAAGEMKERVRRRLAELEQEDALHASFWQQQLELLEQVNETDYLLRCRCSKGTYLRTLCHDIGQALGCGGAMFRLRRTMAAGYSLAEAVSLDDVQVQGAALLRPVETMFAAYPVYVLSSPGKENRVRNGNPITVPELADGTYRVHGKNGEFLCLSRAESGTLTSIKNFFGA
mgnify:CR=1 FL=1